MSYNHRAQSNNVDNISVQNNSDYNIHKLCLEKKLDLDDHNALTEILSDLCKILSLSHHRIDLNNSSYKTNIFGDKISENFNNISMGIEEILSSEVTNLTTILSLLDYIRKNLLNTKIYITKTSLNSINSLLISIDNKDYVKQFDNYRRCCTISKIDNNINNLDSLIKKLESKILSQQQKQQTANANFEYGGTFLNRNAKIINTPLKNHEIDT
jgi:hypothetical protein